MFRPLLLHRYIVKEFLPPFVIGLLVFTFLMVLNHIFHMVDLFLNRGVGMAIIAKMLLLVLPMFLPLSIPMAVLLATFLCYGRLSEDGEITALRSAGCSLFQYTWPNILLGFLLSLTLVELNLNLAPRATQEFRNIKYAVAQQSPLALFAPKVMNHFGEYKIIVEDMDRKRKKLTGVSIYKMNPKGAPTRILAPKGTVNTDSGDGITIELVDGAVHQPSADKESQYTITKFNRFSIRIPARMETPPREFTPREMDYDALRARIRESLTKQLDPNDWKTEVNLRIAIAFSPLVFVVLGTVLGVRLKKGSKSIGIGMSLIIILVYYGLYLLSLSFSSQRLVPPVILTWIPNLATLLVGGILWKRLARQ